MMCDCLYEIRRRWFRRRWTCVYCGGTTTSTSIALEQNARHRRGRGESL